MPYLERGSSMGNSGQRYIETPDYSHPDKQAWSVSFFFHIFLLLKQNPYLQGLHQFHCQNLFSVI